MNLPCSLPPRSNPRYKGSVVLVVNLASQCGFTPQYAELSELYNKYSRKNFTILGFPVLSLIHI